MYLQAIDRQMAVCSIEAATRLIAMDKGYWNVVSIHGPNYQRARLPLARNIHYSCFDDTEEANSVSERSPKPEDLASIFNFIRGLGTGTRAAPLMIQCQQGISRSAAVALSWIYGCLPPTCDRMVRAVDLLLELQPRAKPNRLVLALGMAQFLAPEEAWRVADGVIAEPRLERNRFLGGGQ